MDKVLNIEGKKKTWLLIILTIIVTIGLTVGMIVTGLWQDFFYYPEKEYVLLETEVHRMTMEKDYSTEYECYITENNVNNSKTVKISEESATVTAQIDEKGEISSINRATYKFQHFTLLTAIFGVVIALITGGIYLIIRLIVFIIKHIIKFSKKVKDK